MQLGDPNENEKPIIITRVVINSLLLFCASVFVLLAIIKT